VTSAVAGALVGVAVCPLVILPFLALGKVVALVLPSTAADPDLNRTRPS
jgi:hypothetical protein